MLAAMVIYVMLVLLFPKVFEIPWSFCSKTGSVAGYVEQGEAVSFWHKVPIA